MATFIWTPDYGPTADYEPRTRTTNFGGGYSQVSADGINPINQQWNVSFTNRKQAERDAIIAFLTARGGWDVFSWTTPAGAAVNVRCPKWSEVPTSFGLYNITATFKREYIA